MYPADDVNITFVHECHLEMLNKGELEEVFFPVSVVAQIMSVSPRRVRALLDSKRLSGRRLKNGYWEVEYPLRFVIGTRGPCLKTFQGRFEPKIEEPKPLKKKRPRKYIHESDADYQKRLKTEKWINESEEQFAVRIKTIN